MIICNKIRNKKFEIYMDRHTTKKEAEISKFGR